MDDEVRDDSEWTQRTTPGPETDRGMIAAAEARPEETKHPEDRRSPAGMRIGTLLLGIVIGAAAMFLVLNALTGSVLGESGILDEETIAKIGTLVNLIDESYYEADEVDTDQLQEGLYRGLVDALDDPYSVYYTVDEIEDLEESLSGSFSGIGAYVSLDETTGYPKIAGVIPGSPAEAAGLLTDDIIVEADGESLAGLDLDVAVSRIRGEEGTSVHLSIYRSGEPDYLEFDIVRAVVDSETAAGEMLDAENGIGYIQITEFDDVTCEQVEEILFDLLDQGMEGLVIDLRDNPGGTVDAVTSIAQYLIPKGLIFYMEYPDGTREEYSADGTDYIDLPIAVLINGNSASASEILSSAIQESGAGVVIGTQSYGKGVVQTIYSLTDGTGVKLTVAEYFTRNGNSIHGIGVTPDVEIALDTDAYLEDGTDTQLEAAVSELLGSM